jgi:hypothetical protein
MSKTFIADYDYEGQNEGELTFSEGDSITVESEEDGWLYGELTKTGEKGWYSGEFGHVVTGGAPGPSLTSSTAGPSNPVAAPVAPAAAAAIQMTPEERERKREIVYQQILKIEGVFVQSLSYFIKKLVYPLIARDTPFKRNFLNDTSIAISFNLMRDIFNASSAFYQGIQGAKTPAAVAEQYKKFAPSLQIFAQHASNPCLKAVKSFGKEWREFLLEVVPDAAQSVETTLILPSKHFGNYKEGFQNYVWLIPDDSPDKPALYEALEAIVNETKKIEATLRNVASNAQLLLLESKFISNPRIFTMTRRLLKEGDLEVVQRGLGNTMRCTPYYAHLFNDALIFSSKNSIVGNYTLVKAIDLSTANINQVADINLTNVFAVISSSGADMFRINNTKESMAWYQTIEKSIYLMKEERRGVTLPLISTLPNPTSLGPRARCIVNFLKTEMGLAEAMTTLCLSVINPLFDASKGATLNISTITSTQLSTSQGGTPEYVYMEGSLNRSLFQDEGVLGNAFANHEAITKALKAVDMQVFLKSTESITGGMRDLSAAVRDACIAAGWSEDIEIGSIFSGDLFKTLHHQFKTYTSRVSEANRILRDQIFLLFYQGAEKAWSNYPGSFSEKLEAPSHRPLQYLQFAQALMNCTPEGHKDRAALQKSVEGIQAVTKDVQNIGKDKKSFDKLLAVQKKVRANNPQDAAFLQSLANTTRRFIKEDDMTKICRKYKKVYRFWLFSDYIMYATQNGSSETFQFNRAMDIRMVTAMAHAGKEKNAIEMNSSEKSFVVIAASKNMQAEWLSKIAAAKEECLAKNPLEDIPQSTAAPIWIPDNQKTTCTICDMPFGVSRWRHHCRKCGMLVCGQHSKQTQILRYIHKSERQRVCDRCAKTDPDYRPQLDESRGSMMPPQRPTEAQARRPSLTGAPLPGGSNPGSASPLPPGGAYAPSNAYDSDSDDEPPAQSFSAAPAAAAAPPLPSQDPRFDPYTKMKNMGIPPPAVEGKMRMAGFTDVEIECFQNDTPLPSAGGAPPPGPPAGGGFAPPPPGPGAPAAPPGPPAPPAAPAAPAAPAGGGGGGNWDERYDPFVKMKKILPEGPLRQKMSIAGCFSDAEIDAFVSS